jgi:hypothetical protein
MKKAKRKRLTCSYGTPHLNHYNPPIGNGKGCTHCAKIGTDKQQQFTFMDGRA